MKASKQAQVDFSRPSDLLLHYKFEALRENAKTNMSQAVTVQFENMRETLHWSSPEKKEAKSTPKSSSKELSGPSSSGSISKTVDVSANDPTDLADRLNSSRDTEINSARKSIYKTSRHPAVPTQSRSSSVGKHNHPQNYHFHGEARTTPQQLKKELYLHRDMFLSSQDDDALQTVLHHVHPHSPNHPERGYKMDFSTPTSAAAVDKTNSKPASASSAPPPPQEQQQQQQKVSTAGTKNSSSSSSSGARAASPSVYQSLRATPNPYDRDGAAAAAAAAGGGGGGGGGGGALETKPSLLSRSNGSSKDLHNASFRSTGSTDTAATPTHTFRGLRSVSPALLRQELHLHHDVFLSSDTAADEHVVAAMQVRTRQRTEVKSRYAVPSDELAPPAADPNITSARCVVPSHVVVPLQPRLKERIVLPGGAVRYRSVTPTRTGSDTNTSTGGASGSRTTSNTPVSLTASSGRSSADSEFAAALASMALSQQQQQQQLRASSAGSAGAAAGTTRTLLPVLSASSGMSLSGVLASAEAHYPHHHNQHQHQQHQLHVSPPPPPASASSGSVVSSPIALRPSPHAKRFEFQSGELNGSPVHAAAATAATGGDSSPFTRSAGSGVHVAASSKRQHEQAQQKQSGKDGCGSGGAGRFVSPVSVAVSLSPPLLQPSSGVAAGSAASATAAGAAACGSRNSGSTGGGTNKSVSDAYGTNHSASPPTAAISEGKRLAHKPAHDQGQEKEKEQEAMGYMKSMYTLQQHTPLKAGGGGSGTPNKSLTHSGGGGGNNATSSASASSTSPAAVAAVVRPAHLAYSVRTPPSAEHRNLCAAEFAAVESLNVKLSTLTTHEEVKPKRTLSRALSRVVYSVGK
jgi:hypothetical protein